MQLMRPTQKVVGTELHDTDRAGQVVGDVPVTGEDRIRFAIIGLEADEVAEVLILKCGESGRRRAIVCGANQQTRRHQLIGQRLKTSEGEIEFAMELISSLDKFQRTT